MSYDVGRRCDWAPTLQCLWRRLEVAAPTGHKAWEIPYATSMALKRQKTKNKLKNKIKQNLYFMRE